ncbi:MAG TPA: HD domain-containing protein [Phycisphaerae bacterium]|nr:HD domain-containing protein [Phycisphaerae bacterium]
MRPLDRAAAQARELLVLRNGQNRADLWLWEHSRRVMQLARMLAKLPELADTPPHQNAVALAGLFHDAGWAVQVREAQISPWQVLGRPTNDTQRVLGAALLEEHVAHLFDADTVSLAAEAIRQCNDRYTTLVESRVLADADNLDEIGVMCLLRQFRQYQAEGRPLDQLVASWRRQQEYDYWEVRINDGLRFEATRELARQRLNAVGLFMEALARDLDCADVLHFLEKVGVKDFTAES